MSEPLDLTTSTRVATSLSLLLGAREGDPSSWKRFVTLYSPLIYTWCRNAGIQPSDAEDVAQEVFSSVSTSLIKFSHPGGAGAFRGWLWSITRHKILDHFRGLNRRPGVIGGTEFQCRVEQVPDLPDAVPESSFSEKEGLLLRALELLKGDFQEQTWQAFWRLTVERVTAAQIGEELGMTKKAVRQAKYRVIQRLREEFGEILDLSLIDAI